MYSLFVGVDVSKDSFSAAGLNEKAKLVFSIEKLPSCQVTTDLRDLARERESILKMIASIKNDIKRILQCTFPELEQLVEVLSDTMLRFLKVFPSARLITEARPQIVAQGFDQGDGRRRISVHYTKIIECAKTSVGTISPSKELILPGKIETLFHLKERADTITRMPVKLCKSVHEEDLAILTSVRGIATKTAAPFLAELGDYRNFAS
jgi:transposase